jgi:hypothetical protein
MSHRSGVAVLGKYLICLEGSAGSFLNERVFFKCVSAIVDSCSSGSLAFITTCKWNESTWDMVYGAENTASHKSNEMCSWESTFDVLVPSNSTRASGERDTTSGIVGTNRILRL